jgi:hypothetical protein
VESDPDGSDEEDEDFSLLTEEQKTEIKRAKD